MVNVPWCHNCHRPEGLCECVEKAQAAATPVPPHPFMKGMPTESTPSRPEGRLTKKQIKSALDHARHVEQTWGPVASFKRPQHNEEMLLLGRALIQTAAELEEARTKNARLLAEVERLTTMQANSQKVVDQCLRDTEYLRGALATAKARAIPEGCVVRCRDFDLMDCAERTERCPIARCHKPGCPRRAGEETAGKET